MLKKKTSAHGSPWTKEDVRELRTHSKARTPLPEIAKKMKRTERALRRKAGSSALVSAIIAELCFRGSRLDRICKATGGFLARKAANDVHYDNSTIATASAAKSEIPF